VRRSLGALVVSFVLAGSALGGIAFAGPAHAQVPPVRALAVGDSITTGYGPYFVKKFAKRGLGQAAYKSFGGTNPCDHGWADWVRTYPWAQIDYVVIQDEYVQGSSPCPSVDAWRAAFQRVVDAAKAKSAFVIVPRGNRPDLTGVTGIDVLDLRVPHPDAADGVHYTTDGSKRYASKVVDAIDLRVD
jgi:hypothetical protein